MPQVKDHFGNPVVPDEDKLELLDKIGSQAGFSQHTRNFLGLLVQARRFDVIDEIVAAFEQKYCSITDTQVLSPPFLPPLDPRPALCPPAQSFAAAMAHSRGATVLLDRSVAVIAVIACVHAYQQLCSELWHTLTPGPRQAGWFTGQAVPGCEVPQLPPANGPRGGGGGEGGGHWRQHLDEAGRGGRGQVATLTSAVKLEQEQQFLIAKKLQELTGSKVGSFISFHLSSGALETLRKNPNMQYHVEIFGDRGRAVSEGCLEEYAVPARTAHSVRLAFLMA